MRRHTWSGATAMVVLSLVVAGCGEKAPSGPATAPNGPTTPSTPGSTPVALARKADTLQVDESIQLTAIVPPTPGETSTTTWTSSNTDVAIVTPTGEVFAIKSGTTVVTVTSRGGSDATTVTVKPSVRDVALEADTLAIGVEESVQLPFRVTDSDGNDVNLNSHNVEWTSTAPDVAPLTGDATVTGRTLGMSDVMLRVDGKYGKTNVRVLPRPLASIVVAPSSAALAVGDRVQLATTFLDVYGEPVATRPIVWSSSNPAAVNVTTDGLVVALGAGHADVTARVDSKRTVVAVDVAPLTPPSTTPAPVASVAVALNAPTIQVGQSTQATATIKDASGNTLTGRTVVWTTSEPSSATVSSMGYVTSLRAGHATITAASGGKTGSVTVTSTPPSAPAPVAVAAVSVTLAKSSVVVGQSTQATAVLKDASGAVLTGRTVTWVSSDASTATVDNAGLVSSVKAGSVTITASSGGKLGSAVFTSTPPAPVITNIVLTASASTLKIGQSVQVTGVVKDKNGATVNVPITWSAAPTSIATVTSSGNVTGRGKGVATITVKADTVVRTQSFTVLDTATVPTIPTTPTTPTQPTTPTTPIYPGGARGPTDGGATPAELPRLSVNTSYPAMTRQVKVPAGANLQLALNAAQPGDELLLEPGASYVGNFNLPAKGTSSAWIVIRTDVPDAVIGNPGTRMTPTRAAAAHLAKIQSPNYMSVITTNLAASNYRFTGVEIGATAAASNINALVRLGESLPTQNTVASIAHDLIIDRSWVHGLPSLDLKRCVLLNSATSAIVDSWLGDCHSNQGDSQAIVGYNGPGPYLIANNHLEAGHEVVVFGGGSATIVNQSPSDITLRGNHIMRPLAWKNVWQVKNLLETKHVRRLLVEGNVFENNWADAQAGFAFVLKSENQNNDNPWTTSSDITIRYNRIRNTGNGFNLAANPSGIPAIPAARIVITDNIMENVNVAPYNGDGHTLQLLGGLSDIVMRHNTVTSAGGGGAFTVMLGSLPVVQKLVVHSNVLMRGGYGIKGGGQTEGSISINYFAPGALVTNNAITGSVTPGSYPANNWFPATLAQVGFVSLGAGDVHLSAASSFLSKGYDGREIGADVSQVDALTANAVVAP